MSLSAAFNIISSSFAANAAQTAVVSNNIANVNTPGYSREIANVVTSPYGGADVASVTRIANAALAEQATTSTAQAAAQRAIANGLTALAATINSLLNQFTAANRAVVTGLASGANVAGAEDKRDLLVTQLAQQIGVTTTTAADGSMSIYADSGATLFQEIPRTVAFTATPTLVDGVSGSPVTVDGVPITGPNSPMPIQSGALAGYAALRDTLAPQYEAQLDQIAGGLINAFAESDQSNPPTLPSLPGLFTTAGATALPSMTAASGLAGAIEINPTVDPSQGGNPTLLRDGGISSPNAAYTYNTTGAASFTGRLQELAGAIGAAQNFDPSAGLGASASLADYANASVGWLQGENQNATNASSYQSALAAQSAAALSNATGVNLDAEMTNMLNLENSYASSAKLLTTVNSMFSALLNAA